VNNLPLRRLALACGVSALCCASRVASAAPEAFHLAYREAVPDVTLERNAARAADAGAPAARLRFAAFGRRFDLPLESNAQFLDAPGAAELARAARLELFRGTLAGDADGWARVSVIHDRVYALISDGDDLYAIEAPPRRDSAVRRNDRLASGHYAFRLRDLTGSFRDAVFDGDPAHASPAAQLAEELQAARASLLLRADVGLVADETVSADGHGAYATVLTIMSYVQAIFEAQVGVVLNVAAVKTFEAGPDPFDDTADPGALLMQVSGYRMQSPDLRGLGLVHLYTTRSLAEGILGAAYLETVCDPELAVGVTQLQSRYADAALITAHEFGHNLGAPHDAEPGACVDTPPGYLMSPHFNFSDLFSQCSLDQMAPVIGSAACLHDLVPTDVAVTAQADADAPILGTYAAAHATVTNTSVQDAYGVTLVVDRQVSDFRTDAGQCTIDYALRCALGTLRTGASVRVDFDAMTGSPVRITASAAADDNPANDVVLLDQGPQIAVSMDIALETEGVLPALLAIRSGESAEVAAAVTNSSPIEAHDVTITIASGFDIVDASSRQSACPALAYGVRACAIEYVPEYSEVGVRIALRAPALGPGEERFDSLAIDVTATETNTLPGTLELPLIAYGSSADVQTTVRYAQDALQADARGSVSAGVRNAGPDAAAVTRWRVLVPAQVVVTAASSARADCVLEAVGNSVLCEARDLAVAEEALADLEVLPDRPGAYGLVVRVEDMPGYDPLPDNDESEYPLSVRAPPAPPAPPRNDGGNDGGGGGGGASPEAVALALAALLRAAAHARRAARRTQAADGP
jgi:hypothetical protein